MSISILGYSSAYTNMYTVANAKSSAQSNTQTTIYSDGATDMNGNDNTFIAESAVTALPEENLELDNRLALMYYGNGCYAEVYKDENFSEENPVVSVYTTDPTTNEWTKTTVNLNDVDKNNMSPTEALGVANTLKALGKISIAGALELSNSFDKMYDSNVFTYDDLFEKYDAEALFTKQMSTQYSCGNMQGYLNYKNVYDAFFRD